METLRQTQQDEGRKEHENRDGEKHWSRKYSKCVDCRTTDHKHLAKGLCTSCYPKVHASIEIL
jgi:hypothetical protein